MSDLGKRVQEQVESRLRGLIEEEELAGMIDAAIPVVRAQLQAEVAENVSRLAKKRLSPFFDAYSTSKEFEEHAKALADALVERVVDCYVEDAKALAAGKAPPNGEDSSSRWDDRPKWVSKLVELVDKKIAGRMAEAIERRVVQMIDAPELTDKVESVLANMLPRAAASFLESASFRLVREFTHAISHGREVKVVQRAAASNCPGCGTKISVCTSCNAEVVSGNYCCGGPVY